MISIFLSLIWDFWEYMAYVDYTFIAAVGVILISIAFINNISKGGK